MKEWKNGSNCDAIIRDEEASNQTGCHSASGREDLEGEDEVDEDDDDDNDHVWHAVAELVVDEFMAVEVDEVHHIWHTEHKHSGSLSGTDSAVDAGDNEGGDVADGHKTDLNQRGIGRKTI